MVIAVNTAEPSFFIFSWIYFTFYFLVLSPRQGYASQL